MMSPYFVSYHVVNRDLQGYCDNGRSSLLIRHCIEDMGQVIEKRTIGAGQAKIIKLTITLNNFITLEDQLIPFI